MEQQLRVPMLAVAFFLWLCTAPILMLVLRPRVGTGATLAVALAMLAVFVGVCMGLCRSKPSGTLPGRNSRVPSLKLSRRHGA